MRYVRSNPHSIPTVRPTRICSILWGRGDHGPPIKIDNFIMGRTMGAEALALHGIHGSTLTPTPIIIIIIMDIYNALVSVKKRRSWRTDINTTTKTTRKFQ